jgi:GNAT superfamily N-acetyltransferase
MTTAIQTTRMTSTQIPASGQALARAFFDDPLLMYILPDDATRAKPLEWFMTKGATYGHKYGEVYTTDEKVEGNAVWLPPGDVKLTMTRMAMTGMLAAPLKFGLGAFNRFMKVMNHLEHLHERDLPEKHWYLMILGVDPPRQGQGVGGALIQPILARADAEGLPCYLETMKTRNVPFYQKHGFEVIVEDDLPAGGPHFWTMKRSPRS